MNSKILVTRSSLPPIEDYINEIKEMWDTHWLTNMGPKHCLLQEQLKDYLKVENVELLTNGHMALELSLQALKYRNGNVLRTEGGKRKLEVITTPFTFASTTHAIVRNGMEPVFCDINPIDYTIDVEKIEELITDHTVAILPVHVYGNVCNVEEIERIAHKYDLKVIYDAAHAFGETYMGNGIGQYGDASCFSFHATKVFNTIEGGAVCYSDEEFGRELYRLKNFGIRDEETVDGVGANAKMNEFCAAMGLCNLKYIDSEIEKRRKVAERYNEHFCDVSGIKIRNAQKNVKSNYAYYPVLVEKEKFGKSRNQIFDELIKHDIYARKYFYPLTNTFACFNGKYDVSKTPIAHKISTNVLTLPIYADIEMETVDRICSIVLNI